MKRIKPILFIIIALVAGFILRGCITAADSHDHTAEAAPATWTCSMHPQIQLPKPGKCPICFMDLIPVESSDDDGGEREISVSSYAAKLMELETSPVERRVAEAEVRMVGKVDYDETRVSYISAWVPGRIDRLFIDYTGIPVNEGDQLAELYSPELLTAQEELIQSKKQNPSLINAARERLRQWGVSAAQIAQIEERGTPSDHMTIYSPADGIVIHKNVQEGMYVKTGAKIYTIADLSKVWIQLDAYESDLHWLHEGDKATITTEANPGLVTEGTIAFIAPTINPATRTAKVRLEIDNSDGRLKPGMFVRATVQALLRTDEPPLLIPAAAAMKTGKRAVVYVETPNTQKPTYEGREIELGMRLGDFYVVENGLAEGERVVTRGAFKLDAELQIRARPSMMSMPSEQTGDSPPPTAQTHCPVMGGEINKEVFTDYNGMRIYFCCAGCDRQFKADPEKYIQQMRAKGVEPEKVKSHHEH